MPEKERLMSLLQDAIDEMELLGKMSAGINTPADFAHGCGYQVLYLALGRRTDGDA